LGRQTTYRSDKPLACFTNYPPYCGQAVSTPRGPVPGDHNNDRHNRRRNETKELLRFGPRSRGIA